MHDVPYILSVFADPKQDLVHIKKERGDLNTLFGAAKHKDNIIDFSISPPGTTLMQLIADMRAAPAFHAHIFHFSGHAGNGSVLFDEGKITANSLCTYLKGADTKIVILNGCSTKSLIEEIFDKTSVVAVIATRSAIDDVHAANLSTNFYNLFITQRRSLVEAFHDLSAGFQDSLLAESGVDMATYRELIDNDQLFPDENKDKFQWGLYFKGLYFHNITITNLLRTSITDVERINYEIEVKDRQIYELEDQIKLLGDDPKFDITKKILESQLQIKLAELAEIERQQSLIEKQQASEKIARTRQSFSLKVSEAVKSLNYHDQRDFYEQQKQTSLHSFCAMGDQDSLVDLLLLKFRRDYELEYDSGVKSLPIAFTSGVTESFWVEIKKWIEGVKLSNEEAMRKLITAVYLKSTRSGKKTTAQHVFIRVRLGSLPVQVIKTFIYEFWSLFHSVLSECDCQAPESFIHRFILFLVDDSADQHRHQEITTMMEQINTTLKTPCGILPPIQPVSDQLLIGWIRNHELDKVGIKVSDVTQIMQESDQGKIRKVMSSVKRRIQSKDPHIDLHLFEQLKV